MNEVKLPTVGRTVHFYPGAADETCRANGAQCLPAIVVQEWGNTVANLHVFTANHDAPNVIRFSVDHVSKRFEGSQQGYWDWPPIK
ncbi:MAG TPA: hypothetical protein VGE79_11955 [Niastella sp.]